MKKALTVLAVLAAIAVPAVAPAEPAAETTVARYDFDSGRAPGGMISDASGTGDRLRIRASDGGALRLVRRGTGYALLFPPRCAAGATSCPQVILEGPRGSRLNPGTRPFRFGAWVAATPEQAGRSANVLQKGASGRGGLWKLQIAGQKRARANCVLVGAGSPTVYIVKSNGSVADGAWHQITCQRTATRLTILVDGAAHDSVPVPVGLDVRTDLPLRVGARALRAGADPYAGAIDDVVVAIG
jgi:hypothetical protein